MLRSFVFCKLANSPTRHRRFYLLLSFPCLPCRKGIDWVEKRKDSASFPLSPSATIFWHIYTSPFFSSLPLIISTMTAHLSVVFFSLVNRMKNESKNCSFSFAWKHIHFWQEARATWQSRNLQRIIKVGKEIINLLFAAAWEHHRISCLARTGIFLFFRQGS